MTKTLSKLKQETQKVVNEYIRKRDEGKPCISCGQTKYLQAGHYYPVKGYDGLRFLEDNIHGECEYCNCWDEGHLIGYTHNLPSRIDKHQLKNLQNEAAMYKRIGYRFTRSELEEIKKKYRDKIKEL